MTQRFWQLICGAMALCIPAAPLMAAETPPNAPPQISHEPVKQAVKNQALTMKAKVIDDKGEVASVTLYYTLSKDAAPFKVPLKPAGLDYYVGTLDTAVLSGVSTISYYIEAQDNWGATRETPWYVVTFRDQAGSAPVPAGPPASSPGKIPAPGGEQEGGGIPLGLIAGGAVAVVGGAVLLANSDSGGDGGSSDDGAAADDPAAKQGTYVGTATTCLTLSGATPTCESHVINIVIDSQGRVLSEDLLAGQQLTDTLNGSEFTLVAAVSDPAQGITGEIFYNGTVVSNSKIVGSITGSQQGGIAGSGTYSGSFSAAKR